MPPIAEDAGRMRLPYMLFDAFLGIALVAFWWWVTAGLYGEWGIAGVVTGFALVVTGIVLIIWLDARRDRRAPEPALLYNPTSSNPSNSRRPGDATAVRAAVGPRTALAAGGRLLRPEPGEPLRPAEVPPASGGAGRTVQPTGRFS